MSIRSYLIIIVVTNPIMFDKLCDNLNLLMAETRINSSELARQTDLPASTIKKIRNKDDPNPTLTTLLPLAQYFSLTISQLVGDEPFPESRIKGTYQQNRGTLRQLLLLSWEEAIKWPNIKMEKSHEIITTESGYGKKAYALQVEEVDWENLAKGTILLIDPDVKPEHRDFVILHKDGQKTPTLKQVLYDEEQLYLKHMAQGYGITIFTQEYKILGVVVEYKKYLKKM